MCQNDTKRFLTLTYLIFARILTGHSTATHTLFLTWTTHLMRPPKIISRTSGHPGCSPRSISWCSVVISCHKDGARVGGRRLITGTEVERRGKEPQADLNLQAGVDAGAIPWGGDAGAGLGAEVGKESRSSIGKAVQNLESSTRIIGYVLLLIFCKFSYSY